MNIRAENRATGESRDINMNAAQEQQLIAALSGRTASERILKHKLDNLNLSAEVKSALWELKDWTIKIRSRIYYVGRKLLHILSYIVTHYPNMSASVLLGLLCWYVLSHIPFIGDFLGVTMTAILALLGYIADWKCIAAKDPAQATKIASELATLFGQSQRDVPPKTV